MEFHTRTKVKHHNGIVFCGREDLPGVLVLFSLPPLIVNAKISLARK